MSKTFVKLLVAMTTIREIDGKERRVRFKAGSKVDLTEQEFSTLENLTRTTGTLHFEELEGGDVRPAGPDQGEIVQIPEYAGHDVPLNRKSVPLLKAYLDFRGIAYEAGATKGALLELASQAATPGGDGADDDDPDNGL